MSDPLSEAREALRKISDLLAPEDADVDDVQMAFNLTELALARLDALPAPTRTVFSPQVKKDRGSAGGWCYPDSPEHAPSSEGGTK